MLGDRLQRILVWMLIVAVAVYLLERLFSLTAIFATPLLLFGLAWLVSLILTQLVGVDQTLPSAVNEISKWITALESELRRIGFQGDLERIAQPEALAQQATTVCSTMVQQSLGLAS